MSHIVDLTIEQTSSDSNKRKAEDELQQINHKVIDLTNDNDEEGDEHKNKKKQRKKIQKIQDLRNEHINKDKKKYEESMNKKLKQVMKNCVTFARKMQIYNEAIKNRNHPWFINALHNDGSWKYYHGKWCYSSSSKNDDYLQYIDEIVTVTLTK